MIRILSNKIKKMLCMRRCYAHRHNSDAGGDSDGVRSGGAGAAGGVYLLKVCVNR